MINVIRRWDICATNKSKTRTLVKYGYCRQDSKSTNNTIKKIIKKTIKKIERKNVRKFTKKYI